MSNIVLLPTWFPSQSRQTATGSVLRSAEVEAAAEAPGKLMLAPLEASLPVLVWEDDEDDEDSSSVQNLRVQPGTRLSRHRHLHQSQLSIGIVWTNHMNRSFMVATPN